MLHFKTILLCFVFISIVYADFKRSFQFANEKTEYFLNIASNCSKESNYNIDVSEVFKGKYDDSESFKDFVYCTAVNYGVYDVNGWPKLEKLYELYKDEDVRAALKVCMADLVGDRPKDLATNYFKCWLLKAPITVIF